MNQTKKRLSIINLAISITDLETIQLQILQLGPLRTDEKIQEIITTLKAENYVQAQGLITAYIETPTKVILQRTFQKEKEKRKIQDNNTIDEFNLFAEPENSSEIKNLDFDDMVAFSDEVMKEKPKKVEKNIDFDSLLNIDAGDILPNNIKLKTNNHASNTFWEKPDIQTNDIPRDTFFDTEEQITKPIEEKLTEELFSDTIAENTEEIIEEEPTQKEVMQETMQETMEETLEEMTEEIIEEEPTQKEVMQETMQETMEETMEETLEETLEEMTEEPSEVIYSEKENQEEEENIETFGEETREELKELKPQKQNDETETKNTKYKAIPYIDQKFKNMHVQYPPVQETLEIFPSVTAWLEKISHEEYCEKDIEEMIKKIDSLGVAHKEEAAQLVLITAATESKYAQFKLARALYKGEILQKNLPESFTLINRLATHDDYPEAICDLAQFYEYGIGIDKDKKKAELLYKEAMNSGIKRATDHYKRIKKQNKGLFSFLKK